MKALITGGSGAVGQYVVGEFASQGFDITILDVRPPAARGASVAFVECDLMDMQATLDTVRGYDVVVHLAAIPIPYHDPHDRVMAVNMVTCFNVLEAVRQNGIRRIVF
jgi:nucleoside-diphosphate-sugar epimerase